MKYSVLALMILVVMGCGESPKYKDFSNLAPDKTEKIFYQESAKCEADKNSASSEIRSRELGYKGLNTAYQGWWKEKGWETIQPGLY